MMRTVSLSFQKRTTSKGQETSVSLLVLDERTGDVITDLTLDPNQWLSLCSGSVIRVREEAS